MLNDIRLFSLVPAADKARAIATVNAAFADMGVDFINYDPEWSSDGGLSHTHYAAELPVPSAVVTRFSLAVVYRALYPEPEEGSAITEVFRGDDFIARLDGEGRCIALLFAHKAFVKGAWQVIHGRDAVALEFGCSPYSDTPPI